MELLKSAEQKLAAGEGLLQEKIAELEREEQVAIFQAIRSAGGCVPCIPSVLVRQLRRSKLTSIIHSLLEYLSSLLRHRCIATL